MSKKNDWSTFYDKTKSAPPSKLLVKALMYLNHKGKALDVGGGALKDSRFLLEKGFDVTDLDNQELEPRISEGLNPKKFRHAISSFADFDFPKNEYDIVSAMYSLPFNPPNTFQAVFERIKKSLRMGGIFCGNLFGDRDEWSTRSNMTFHTREEAKEIFKDMSVLLFEEKEWDGKLVDGKKKHWNTFNFIVRKT